MGKKGNAKKPKRHDKNDVISLQKTQHKSKTNGHLKKHVSVHGINYIMSSLKEEEKKKKDYSVEDLSNMLKDAISRGETKTILLCGEGIEKFYGQKSLKICDNVTCSVVQNLTRCLVCNSSPELQENLSQLLLSRIPIKTGAAMHGKAVMAEVCSNYSSEPELCRTMLDRFKTAVPSILHDSWYPLLQLLLDDLQCKYEELSSVNKIHNLAPVLTKKRLIMEVNEGEFTEEFTRKFQAYLAEFMFIHSTIEAMLNAESPSSTEVCQSCFSTDPELQPTSSTGEVALMEKLIEQYVALHASLITYTKKPQLKETCIDLALEGMRLIIMLALSLTEGSNIKVILQAALAKLWVQTSKAFKLNPTVSFVKIIKGSSKSGLDTLLSTCSEDRLRLIEVPIMLCESQVYAEEKLIKYVTDLLPQMPSFSPPALKCVRRLLCTILSHNSADCNKISDQQLKEFYAQEDLSDMYETFTSNTDVLVTRSQVITYCQDIGLRCSPELLQKLKETYINSRQELKARILEEISQLNRTAELVTSLLSVSLQTFQTIESSNVAQREVFYSALESIRPQDCNSVLLPVLSEWGAVLLEELKSKDLITPHLLTAITALVSRPFPQLRVPAILNRAITENVFSMTVVRWSLEERRQFLDKILR